MPSIKHTGTNHSFNGFGFLQPFFEALSHLTPKEMISADKNPTEYIAPLLQGFSVVQSNTINALRTQHQRWLLSEKADKTAYEDKQLRLDWRHGRLSLENIERMVRDLKRYMDRNLASSSDVLIAHVRTFESLLADGRVVEAHIRDELDLHNGILSLEQSRISIEISHRSITQASSVARITVLAFFFLPLSLVTSFFGMNVEEFSGNGSSFRVFFIAAGCLTAATLLFWSCWLCVSKVAEIHKRLRTLEKQRLQHRVLGNRSKNWRKHLSIRKYMTWDAFKRELKKDWGPAAWSQSPRLLIEASPGSSTRSLNSLV